MTTRRFTLAEEFRLESLIAEHSDIPAICRVRDELDEFKYNGYFDPEVSNDEFDEIMWGFLNRAERIVDALEN